MAKGKGTSGGDKVNSSNSVRGAKASKDSSSLKPSGKSPVGEPSVATPPKSSKLWVVFLLLFIVMFLVGMVLAGGIYFKLIDLSALAKQYQLYKLPVVGQYVPQPDVPVIDDVPPALPDEPKMTEDLQNQPPLQLPTNPEIEKQKQLQAEKQAKEQAKAIAKAARLYADMEPDKAVAILNNLDDNTVVAILNRMDDEQVSKLLAAMDPQRAARLTRQIIKK